MRGMKIQEIKMVNAILTGRKLCEPKKIHKIPLISSTIYTILNDLLKI